MPRRRIISPASPADTLVSAGELVSPSSALVASSPTSGTLILVSTPIGNWEDISLRALRILRESALIIAEDARVSRKLLNHFALATPLLSLTPRRNNSVFESLLSTLEGGKNVALITDAGTPGIADPGLECVRLALAHSYQVSAVPGPTAALCALVVSGLPTGRFAFDGFPPRSRADRASFFALLASEARTILLYESAAYLPSTLRELYAVLGPDRPMTLACHLTRPEESVVRGTLSDILQHVTARKLRGEFVLVVGGAATEKGREVE